MNFYLKIFSILSAAAAVSCSSFNPSASFDSKWSKISGWISDQNKYVVAIDTNSIAKTDLGKDLIPELAGFGINGDAGILVFTKSLVFVGGRFDEKAVLEKIKAGAKSPLTEELFLNKTIYTDGKTKSSFAFLEKFLICQGKEKDIKNLIKAGKQATSPKIDTGHQIAGVFKYKSDILLYADIVSSLDFSAKATFKTSKDASVFAEELEGIKTIKTIESVDEPWLADALDEISIEQSENVVKISAKVSLQSAKKILEGFFL